MVAAESSEIKNKAKLREYLYKNPIKLAMKLAKMLETSTGELLTPVRLKGEGKGYYYSHHDKKFIHVPRNSEYYLLPWVAEKDNECYIYAHHTWLIGVILRVPKDELDFIGFN